MSVSVLFLVAIIIVGAALIFVVPWALNRYAEQYDSRNTLFEAIDWDALRDDTLQSYLPDQKINAIKRYRELTGQNLSASKFAIDFIVKHPERLKKRTAPNADDAGAGVRDLVAEGRYEDAEKVYAAYMGVDVFTAKDAVMGIRRDVNAEAALEDSAGDDDDADSIRALLDAGRKIEAIKLYMAHTGVDLKTAKQAIDGLE